MNSVMTFRTFIAIVDVCFLRIPLKWIIECIYVPAEIERKKAIRNSTSIDFWNLNTEHFFSFQNDQLLNTLMNKQSLEQTVSDKSF